MDILPKLFGSLPRVKLMRLFLYNQDASFSLVDILKKSKLNQGQARKELSLLENLGMLKTKRVAAAKKSSGGRKHWFLNPDFFFVENLKSLFNSEFLSSREDLVKRFKGCGRLKLILLSGLFVQDGGGRADIVIVGEDLKRRLIEKTMSQLEAEIGRELLYAVMDTRDFVYRLHSSDKFLRDILDYPHQRVLDKLVF